jgi:nitrogen-specific signal transduction histidine kinase
MNYQALLHGPIIPTQIVTWAQKAAHNNAPVLIQGEPGTGKELIAKIIHHTGDWKYYRFHKMDCKILSENKFTEELLHLFKETNYGTIPATLYLKGVGSLGQVNQLNLLELMEDGVFQNGIEKKVIKNLRFIASSSEDLKEKVAQGGFSEDLYYRFRTQSILIPPLRSRVEEIPSIAQYMLAEHSKEMKIENKDISNNVLRLLQKYWWPGNLKELEHVMIRSAIYSEGKTLMENDLFFETENENSSFISFLKESEKKPPALQKRNSSAEQNAHALSFFFIELVHRIKNPLVSIKTFTQLLREKFSDTEFRDYFYRIVTEDIEKIDLVLNGLLSYIKVDTPIEKTNTVHFILEDILKKNADQFEEKKIKIFRKFEEGLPETIVHDEQLRYILNSLVQYAIPSIPPNGSIGFLTKSLDIPRGNKTLVQKDERYIEIMIVFTGYKKQKESFENVLGVPAIHREDAVDLELRLIKEIIQKNQGTIKFEVNEKQPRTFISLKFPIERRKVIYYQSMNA